MMISHHQNITRVVGHATYAGLYCAPLNAAFASSSMRLGHSVMRGSYLLPQSIHVQDVAASASR